VLTQAEADNTTAKDQLRQAKRDAAKLKTTLTRGLRKAHTNVVRLLCCTACCCTGLRFEFQTSMHPMHPAISFLHIGMDCADASSSTTPTSVASLPPLQLCWHCPTICGEVPALLNPVLSCTLPQVLVERLQVLLAASEVTLKQQQQHVCGLEALVDRLLLDVASAQQQLQDMEQRNKEVSEPPNNCPCPPPPVLTSCLPLCFPHTVLPPPPPGC
jgi:hypothetical protein